MKKFDLTTVKGVQLAKKYAEGAFLSSTPLYLVYTLFDKLIFRNERVEMQQREMAKDLIVKGNREGVDEMEISVDNHTGLKFDAPVDANARINCELGAGDKMTIKVKYKK